MPYISVFQPYTQEQAAAVREADMLELERSRHPWSWSDELPYDDNYNSWGDNEAWTNEQRRPVILRGSRIVMRFRRTDRELAIDFALRAFHKLRFSCSGSRFHKPSNSILLRVEKYAKDRWPCRRHIDFVQHFDTWVDGRRFVFEPLNGQINNIAKVLEQIHRTELAAKEICIKV